MELLPVHHHVDEQALVERGLTNYWGYNTIAFFAPDGRYASTGSRGEQVREFKAMVKALHRAGLEVILDVVYNHTAEGNRLTAPRLERAIGVVYRPETELQSHYFHASLPRQFDEYIWFRETHAVQPITSGEARMLSALHPFTTQPV